MLLNRMKPSLEEVLRDNQNGFRPGCSTTLKIADIEFADDVALITDTIEEAKLLLERLEKAALSVELAMNDTKTKFVTLNMRRRVVLIAVLETSWKR